MICSKNAVILKYIVLLYLRVNIEVAKIKDTLFYFLILIMCCLFKTIYYECNVKTYSNIVSTNN